MQCTTKQTLWLSCFVNKLSQRTTHRGISYLLISLFDIDHPILGISLGLWLYIVSFVLQPKIDISLTIKSSYEPYQSPQNLLLLSYSAFVIAFLKKKHNYFSCLVPLILFHRFDLSINLSLMKCLIFINLKV